MDLTTKRRSLVATAAGMMVGAAGAIGWSLSGIEPNESHLRSPRANVPSVTVPENVSRPFDAKIARRSLRGPLYDPPPRPTQRVIPTTPTPPPTTPSLDMILVGTIIDSDDKFAIVADATGKFDVKGVGQLLELSPQGVTIEEIESEHVTLQYGGRQSRVGLDRSKNGKANKGVNRGNNRRRDNR